MSASRLQARKIVDRRIGGLEKPPLCGAITMNVDRRIGGLENKGGGVMASKYVDRRIGGLEKSWQTFLSPQTC